MASICGSTMALMDAGVPIKAPVAGVAMGLITGDDGRLQDPHRHRRPGRHLGDMDFKVAGTRDGITAVQADFKIQRPHPRQVREIIARAREGPADHPRQARGGHRRAAHGDVAATHRAMYRIQIPPAKIGAIIGPGGKMIRSIIEETKCTVDVEDDGSVFVGSSNEENARKAIAIIEGLTQEAEIGQIYTGRVTRTVDFGAFVEIMPGKEGLVRIGELADHRVPTVEDVVNVGDELEVMVTGNRQHGPHQPLAPCGARGRSAWRTTACRTAKSPRR